MQAELVRFLGTRDNYSAYAKYINKDVLAPEVYEIISVLGDIFKTNPALTEVDFVTSKPFFMLRCTKAKGPQLDALLSSINAADTSTYNLGDVIGDFIKMDYSNEIVEAVMKANGKPDPADLKNIVSRMEEALSGVSKKDSHLIEFDLNVLSTTFIRSGGYKWRLDFLNECVGPIAGGDLVVVAARPETGKTTFITSEVTFMLSQMRPDESVIIFNNEEKGEKVLGRVVQSALGITAADIAADVKKAEAEYIRLVGRKDRVRIYNRANMSTYDVDRVLKNGNFKIIVFNVLDKVKGFKDSGNETERLRHLYQWARGLASEHDAVVFVVAQADATAENVKYIYQDQLYNSKTAIQGEADLLITIGAIHGVDDRRFINLPKNKIPPVAGVNTMRSHGHDEIRFDGQRGRYY